MKTLLAWLFGTVTARITGAQPEDFLNLCARENLVLWRMVQRDLFTLEVQVTARQYARLCQLAQGAQCGVELEKRQGLPYFFSAVPPAVCPAGGGGPVSGPLRHRVPDRSDH